MASKRFISATGTGDSVYVTTMLKTVEVYVASSDRPSDFVSLDIDQAAELYMLLGEWLNKEIE